MIFHSIEGVENGRVEEGRPTTFNLIDAPDLSRGPIFDPGAKLEIYFWTNRPPSLSLSKGSFSKVGSMKSGDENEIDLVNEFFENVRENE